MIELSNYCINYNSMSHHRLLKSQQPHSWSNANTFRWFSQNVVTNLLHFNNFLSRHKGIRKGETLRHFQNATITKAIRAMP